MNGTFRCCDTEILDLRSFNTRKVEFMQRMFAGCKSKVINLSSFHISDETKIHDIFDDCKADIITKDARLKEAAISNGLRVYDS